MAATSSFVAAMTEAYHRPSNIDWCEANYAVLDWVAECYNTFSSIPMCGLAAYGCYRARQHLKWETRWALAWLALGVVGFGSALFHATLRHVFQAADELPMLYCNLIFIYLMLEEGSGATHAPRKRWLAPLLVAVGAAQTVVYVAFPALYGVFLLSYLAGTSWLVQRSVRLAWFAPPGAAGSTPLQRRLCWIALMCYLGGGALWIFENTVCGVHGEGGGGWVLQWAHLHAWWHIGASCGTYHFIEYYAARRGAALKLGVRSAGSLLPYIIHDLDTEPKNK